MTSISELRGSGTMENSEDLSDVILSLQKVLKRMDELGLRIAAVKVAEALEVLSLDSDQADW